MTRVAVAAPDLPAAAAGTRLAEIGGNAVDAALAAVLVAAVCEPGVCSPGGGAFVTIGPADGSPPETVDGNVEMPGRELPSARFGRGVREVTTGYGGGLEMTVGHGSVATPGAMAAFDLAHRRHGRAPWREVVAPAIEAARDGFALGTASHYYLRYVHESVYGWHPESFAALHDDAGALLPLGATVRLPDLAVTLQQIADEGAAAMYTGDLGRRIAADMAENDGLLTAADLAAYEPLVRPALTFEAGGWQLATNPPPAIGGAAFVSMLLLLGDRPHGRWTADDLEHLAAVQEAVLVYRAQHLDVTDDREAAVRRLIELSVTGELHGLLSPSTAHVSVVDTDGQACAVTTSAGYGSGVMTPGTGMWLNNCLGEHELNRGGLHSWPPGERLPSNMAPTVGRHADGAALAIGSPGADRITTALLQVLAPVLHAGMPLEEAIAQPRLHVRVIPGPPADVVVEHEADLQLPPLGRTTRAHEPLSMYFGGVAAALRRGDGSLFAAADPRRSGVVAVTPDGS